MAVWEIFVKGGGGVRRGLGLSAVQVCGRVQIFWVLSVG